MKPILSTSFALCILLACQPDLLAQDETAKYLAQAMSRLTKLTSEQQGQGFKQVADNISIYGGWVTAKKHVTFSLPVVANKTYCIVAAGDDDSKDVDLEVVDRAGQVLQKDNALNREAVVRFTPQTTETITVRLTLFESHNNLPCVCVALVLQKQ